MRPVPPTFTERRPVVSLVLLQTTLLAVALAIGVGVGTAGSWVVTSLLDLVREG